MLDRVKSMVAGLRRSNGTLDAFMTLGTGQVWAQIAQLAFIPVLTRLYTPAQYGEFAVFSLVSTTAMAFCTWRYEMAIVLAEDDAKGRDLFALTVLLSVIGALAAYMSAAWAGGGEGLLGYAWSARTSGLLASAMLLQALYTAMGYWLLRVKAFRLEARGRMILAAGVGVSQAAAVLAPGIGNGLIAGYVAGYAMAVAGLSCWVVSTGRAVAGRVEVRGMLAMARRYRRFPQLSTWEVFAARAVLLLPPMLLAHFFGTASAGLFSLARNVFNIPLSLITEPASKIFLVKARETAADSGALGGLCRRWIWRLALPGVPVLGCIAWLAPTVFGGVFGEEWVEAGPYMLALLPITLARFVVVPIMPSLVVLERQRFMLLWQVVLAVVVMIGYSLLSLFFGPLAVVGGVGVLCALWYAWLATSMVCGRRLGP